MSIPPLNRQPSQSSKRDDGPGKSDPDKEFKLKGKEAKDKLGEKKKDLFDMAVEAQIKEMKQEVGNGKLESINKELTGIEAKGQVSQIGSLIQKMVESMMIGTVGGKEFTSLNLSKGPEVPQAFAGSNLTLSYEANGLVIHFDNFASLQQQQTAVQMVEQNKEQLAAMIQALQVKNIQVAEFSIGDRKITLPSAEPLPPPMQATQAEQPETRREQGQEERGDQGEPEER